MKRTPLLWACTLLCGVVACAGSSASPALPHADAAPSTAPSGTAPAATSPSSGASLSLAEPALIVPVRGAPAAPLTVITLLRTGDVASTTLFDAMCAQQAQLGTDALRWVLITGDGKFEIDSNDSVQLALHSRFGGDASFVYLERVLHQGQAVSQGAPQYGERLQAGLAVQRSLSHSRPAGAAPPAGNTIGPTKAELLDASPDSDRAQDFGETQRQADDADEGREEGEDNDGDDEDSFYGIGDREFEFDEEVARNAQREDEERARERAREETRREACESAEQCAVDAEINALRLSAARAQVALSINGLHVVGLPSATGLEQLLSKELQAALQLQRKGTAPNAIFGKRVQQNSGRVVNPAQALLLGGRAQ